MECRGDESLRQPLQESAKTRLAYQHNYDRDDDRDAQDNVEGG
jgi:hypothetical protein